MNLPDNWRKSSYSNGGQTTCVEVADSPAVVLVRDSKNASGGTLAVRPAAWHALISRVQ